jgi:hypothetical protein
VQLDEPLRKREPEAGSSRCSMPVSVCWNSSKIRLWSSGAMPGPVSATETRHLAVDPIALTSTDPPPG